MGASATVDRLAAAFLLIASLGVLLVELKFIPLNLPHYNLYLPPRLGGHRPGPAPSAY
ncbi:MAG: hypothetical protein WAV07_17025 [Candidatus Contendobacter sp.]